MYRGVAEVPMGDEAAADPLATNARVLQVGGVVANGEQRQGRQAPTKAELSKKRVAELKALCLTRGVEPKGVKAALIAAILGSYKRHGKSSRSSSSSSSTSSSSSSGSSASDSPTVRATYFPMKQRLVLEWLSSAVRRMLLRARLFVIAFATATRLEVTRPHPHPHPFPSLSPLTSHLFLRERT